MSEAEEQEQEQVNTQEGLHFYKALQDFFGKDTRFAIWVLHVLADEVHDAIREASDLPRDIYELAGRARTVHELYWHTDRYSIVLNTLAEPEARQALMRAIALMADAYNMLKSNSDIDMTVLRDKLEEATRLLYATLKAVLDYAQDKVDSPDCPDSDP